MKKIDLTNYLQSGFTFTKQENDLKLKYQFFNVLLVLNLFVVSTASFLRFFRGENLQGFVDITYSLVGLLVIFLTRKNKKYFNALIKFVMLFSLLIVSFTYVNNTNAYVGISWFFVQIMIVLFLSDKKFAYFMLFASMLIILTTQYLNMHFIDFKNAVFGLFPLMVFSVFITIYEKRNRLQKTLLEEQNALLEKYAFEIENYDSVTHLPNRKLFMKNINQKVFSSKEEQFSIIKVDIDNFKNVNDSYGYDFADKIAQELANRLNSILSKDELLSKSGPDEFYIFINTDSLGSIHILNSEIMDCLKEVFIIDSQRIFITVSLGIVRFPHDGDNSSTLIQNLDAALHLAKKSGKHCAKFYDTSLSDEINKKMSLLVDLQDAVSNNEFEVYFQPQVDANTDKIIGMEALIRWIHPTIGLISPVEFIPLAEEHDLIKEIDFFVMRSAMESFIEWKKVHPKIGRLSLNLSMKLLEDPSYISYLKETLLDLSFSSDWLELEITESQIMADPKKSIEMLQELQELGIYISIDDFGTGYSSLSYLQKLPISKLKIDRSFIVDIPTSQSAATLVKLIINLADSLGLSVIAEGIETKEQKNFLLQNKCSSIQGYFYAKPLNKINMTRFVKTHCY